jgi:transposase
MTSMATTAVFVTGGVDTHGHTHHAAVLDYIGRQLGDREFPTSPAGYRALLQWMRGHGVLDRVGVEGTGTYGVGLARHLREAGVHVVEVDRPDRRARRAQGKSDPLDAYSAAQAALSGRASVVPKVRDGKVEAIRAIRVARSSAVKARTQATNQLKALIVTGSPGFRQQLRHLSTPLIIAHCARLRPSPDLGDPEQATKTALRRLARRHQQLSEEITEADRELHQLVRDVAPALLDLPGVGSEVAGQVLISIGDNADRLKSEAAFAHLCGAAPIPASSGRTHRHRLNHGGDRSANNALYVVVLGTTRRSHPRIRRETNPRRASQARNYPLSQALRCPRDLQHTQSGDASKEARTTTCKTIGASTPERSPGRALAGRLAGPDPDRMRSSI